VDIDVEAEGASVSSALDCLRQAVADKLTELDEVAPPSCSSTVHVTLVEAPPEERSPFGPGDPA